MESARMQALSSPRHCRHGNAEKKKKYPRKNLWVFRGYSHVFLSKL